MKKILALTLMACMAVVANAGANKINGIYYNLDSSEMTATVIESQSSSVVYSGDVVIPESVAYNGETYTVTTIGESAFDGCKDITSITLPGSLTTISNYAFGGCKGLKAVYITDLAAWCSINISMDGGNPLSYAHRLYLNGEEITELHIPEGITEINASVFESCTSITIAYIRDGVTKIGDCAFFGCSNLSAVVFPSSLTTIGEGSFWNCSNIVSVTIPESVLSIGTCAFQNTGLKRIIFEDGWEDLNFKASIPGLEPFGECPLEYVYLGRNTVTEINPLDPFWMGCQNLPPFSSDTIDTVKLGKYVTTIETCAFRYSKISKFYLSESLTTIRKYAFRCCEVDTLFVGPVPPTVDITTFGYDTEDYYDSNFGQSDYNIYTECVLAAPTGYKSRYIGTEYWSEFTHVIEYGDYKTGGIYYALDKTNKTAKVIPSYNSDVSYSGNIVIPSKITCSGTSYTVTSIGDSAFYDTSIKSITLPNSVTTIGNYAFSFCMSLSSVTFPSNMTSIGVDAFAFCYGLKSITLPDGLFSIQDGTFRECLALQSVDIPSTVTSIGNHAFASCTSLLSIYAEGETPATIYRNTFDEVDKNACTLYVPVGCKSVYANADYWSEFEHILVYDKEENTDVSTLDDALYIEALEGRIGGSIDIPIKLKNTEGAQGFQFILEVPEGVTINGWALSEDRLPAGATTNNMVSSYNIEDSKITVACALNYNSATFTGNDGEVATVNVSFGEDMAEGSYPLYLSDCGYSNAAGKDLLLEDVKSSVTLESYLVGDANGDGLVRIGDVTAILNYIIGKVTDGFNVKAADANEDGLIRIGDVTTVLNVIVGKE